MKNKFHGHALIITIAISIVLSPEAKSKKGYLDHAASSGLLCDQSTGTPSNPIKSAVADRRNVGISQRVTNAIQQVSLMEHELFRKTYDSEALINRIARLESTVFPQDKIISSKSLNERVTHLMAAVPISPATAEELPPAHGVIESGKRTDVELASPKKDIDQASIIEKALSDIEQSIFHKQYNEDIITARIARLENHVYGKIQGGAIQHRIDALILRSTANSPAPAPKSEVAKSEAGNSEVTKSELAKSEVTSIPNNSKPASAITDIVDSVTSQIEQRAWDASALIDDLMESQDKHDTKGMCSARDKLFALPHRESTEPTNSEDLSEATTLHNKGVRNFDQGNFDESLSDLKKAILLNPWDESIVNDLVGTQIKLKDLKAASTYCPLAISIDPASSRAWCNMAEIFARAKQFTRARDCAYLAFAMSDDRDSALELIKSALGDIADPLVAAPMKEALLMIRYIAKDDRESDEVKLQFAGPEADIALYKSKLLLQIAPNLQELKHNTGIVLVVNVARDGKILNSEVLRSSNDRELDNTALKIIASSQLPPLPKSNHSESRQFIVPLDKVVQALTETTH